MAEWWQSIAQFFGDIRNGLWLKAVGAFLFALSMDFLDAHPSAMPLVYLMLIDLVLGLWRAWGANRLSWAGVKRGVVKFGVYGVALIIAHHVDEGFGSGVLEKNFTWGTCCLLISAEALSAFRHLEKIGGHKLPAWIFARLRHFSDSLENPGRRSDDWRPRRSSDLVTAPVRVTNEEEDRHGH